MQNNSSKAKVTIPCTECKEQFETYNSMKSHRLRKHGQKNEKLDEEKKFTCDICDGKFTQKKNLNAHLKKPCGKVGQNLVQEETKDSRPTDLSVMSVSQQVSSDTERELCDNIPLFDIGASIKDADSNQEQGMLLHKQLIDETQSLIGSLRSFASTAASENFNKSVKDANAATADTVMHQEAQKMAEDKSFGLIARSAIYNQRAKRLILKSLTQQEVDTETRNESLCVSVDKVTLFLEQQQQKYCNEQQQYSSPEQAQTFLEWINRSRSLLQLHYSTTQNSFHRANIIKEIERIGSIVSVQQEWTNAAYAFNQWGEACHQLGIINIDNNIEMEEPQESKCQCELAKHQWSDYVSEFGFSFFYPQWFLDSVREQMKYTPYIGEKSHSDKVGRRLQKILHDKFLFSCFYSSINKLPAFIELDSEDGEEEEEKVKAAAGKPATRRATGAAIAKIDLTVESEVFEILRKRAEVFYCSCPHNSVGNQEQQSRVKVLPIYSIPASIFEYGPPGIAEGYNGARLQQMLDSFFSVLIEIKTIKAKFIAGTDMLFNKGPPTVQAMVGKIRSIHGLVCDKLMLTITTDWKRQLLNYVFRGCLPHGVKKAKIFFGNTISLPVLEMQKHFTEGELTFTCFDKVGKRLDIKSLDETSQRRKRTLKMQMKKRELQSIGEDASKVGCIDKILMSTVHLRKLYQQIVDHLESIIKNVTYCQSVFSEDKTLDNARIPCDIMQMVTFQLREQLHKHCLSDNKELKKKRAAQNYHIQSETVLSRWSVTRRLKKIRSLAIAQDEPLTVMQQLEYIQSHVGSVINSQLKPLMEIFQYHVAHRDSTELRFINCSQWELTKYSSNELVKKSTAQRWKWLNDQDVNSMLSHAVDLASKWQEMITKQCLIVQVYSIADIRFTFDELVIDLHPEFNTSQERLAVYMPQCVVCCVATREYPMILSCCSAIIHQSCYSKKVISSLQLNNPKINREVLSLKSGFPDTHRAIRISAHRQRQEIASQCPFCRGVSLQWIVPKT